LNCTSFLWPEEPHCTFPQWGSLLIHQYYKTLYPWR
jgi:hypothetical protein